MISFAARDPMRKVFAIIFAFGLWIYVAIGNSYSYRRTLKVEYTNLPDTFIIVDSVPNIDATFSGRGGALFTIWAAPPRAQCDLKQARIGRIDIPVRDLRIPVSYGPLRIDHDGAVITVSIDRRIERAISVEVPVKGSPKQGFAIDNILLVDTIMISGPERLLEQMDEVLTESLNVRNRSTSFEKELRLSIPSPLIASSRQSVNALVQIEKTITKTITNVPLIIIHQPDQLLRSDRTAVDTLVVEGSARRVENLTARDIEVRIKATKLAPGEYRLPAEIILPRYVRPIISVPQKFRITVY